MLRYRQTQQRLVTTTTSNPLIRNFADGCITDRLCSDDHWWLAGSYISKKFERETHKRFKVVRTRNFRDFECNPPGARRGAFPNPVLGFEQYEAFWAPHYVYDEVTGGWILVGSLKPDREPERVEHANGHCSFVARTLNTVPTGFGQPKILRKGPWITCIDPSFFKSSITGLKYCVYGSGFGGIFIQEMMNDWSDFMPGTHPKCILMPFGNVYLVEAAKLIEHPVTLLPWLLVSGPDTFRGPYETYAFEGQEDPTEEFKPFPDGNLLIGQSRKWTRVGQPDVVKDDIDKLFLFGHGVEDDRIIAGTEEEEPIPGWFGIPERSLFMAPLLYNERRFYVKDQVVPCGLIKGPTMYVRQ